MVRWEELPLGLGDERRRFASGIAGVRLTHPGGRLEGGPGVMGGEGAGDKADVGVEVGEGGGEDAKVRDVNRGDGDVDMTGMTEGKPGSQAPEDPFAKLPKKVQDFLREHEIETQEQLQAVVKREQKEQIDELKECMREREAAKVKNEELDEKIEELVAERETERKVYERIKKARAKG